MAQESWTMERDETGCQPPEGPILCANSCGFFGSTATMNLCSQCYRDHVMRQAQVATAAAAVATAQNEQPAERSDRQPQQLQAPGPGAGVGAVAVAVTGPSSQALVGDVTAPVDSSMQPPGQPPNRCSSCKKRLGLSGFKCRCGNVFCSLHRYSDKHQCTFDYRTAARDAIAKANPVVKAEKIDKI